MDTMNSEQKLGIMAKLRNSKGFSLIEMAIVLVIIGIIIAAIIKGQDLITNSQAKKVVSTASQWRNLAMTFYDRNGRFPGDEGKNGIIGDEAGELSTDVAATAEIVGVMEQTPDNPLILGSVSLYMYLGNVYTASLNYRNALIICGDSLCSLPLTKEQLEFVKSVDTSVDGVADAGLGTFRSFTSTLTMSPAAPTSVSNRYSATVSSIRPTNSTSVGAAAVWSSVYRGAVWLFDKPF